MKYWNICSGEVGKDATNKRKFNTKKKTSNLQEQDDGLIVLD